MDPKNDSPFQPRPGSQFVSYNPSRPVPTGNGADLSEPELPSPANLPRMPEPPQEISAPVAPAVSAVPVVPVAPIAPPVSVIAPEPSVGMYREPLEMAAAEPAAPAPLPPQSFTPPPMPVMSPSDPRPADPMPVTPVSPPSQPPRGRFAPQPSHRWPVILSIVVVALLVVVGGAYAAYAIAVAPGNALPGTFAGIDNAKKAHSDLTITLASADKNLSGSSFSVSTDMDASLPGNTSTDSVIAITAEASGQTLTFAGEIRLVNNVLYGELSTFPAAYNTYLSAIANRWYSLSVDSVKSLSTSYGVASSTVTRTHPSLGAVYAGLEEKGIFSNTSFVGIVKHNGQFVRKYSLTVDKKALAGYIQAVYATALANATSTSAVSAYSAAAGQELTTMLDQVTFQPILIYTTLFGGALSGVDAGVTVTPPVAANGSSSMVPTASTPLTINFVYNYDGSRSDITIVAPVGASSLDAYLKNSLAAMNGGMSKAQANGTDARIISDIQQIRTEKEVQYDGHTYNQGACASDKLMVTLASDIKSKGSALICRESSSAYALAAKLTAPAATTGAAQYFCIDSTGQTAYLAKVPTTTICK